MGGFESSSHRLRNGQRLDLIAATEHDRYCYRDYMRLQELGIRTARDGVRWHLVENAPGRYDFASVRDMIRAARTTNTEIIWDLFHYGWPDDVDIFRPEFVKRFSSYAAAFVDVLAEEIDDPPLITLINEPSFVAWGGGDVAYLNPFCTGRGFELKAQLVRAAIVAAESILERHPRVRFFPVDPVINVVPNVDRPSEDEHARQHHEAQYHAWDMLCGRLWPLLGGAECYVPTLGLNFYGRNQWIHGQGPLSRHHPLYRPLHQILVEVYQRYQRPLWIAETGTEDDDRAAWFAYVHAEVCTALQLGVPMEGICLYPIVNHPGWDDGRHCHNGLWDYPDALGQRPIHEPLANDVRAASAWHETIPRENPIW